MQSVPAPARLTPGARRLGLAALLAGLASGVAIAVVLLSAAGPPAAKPVTASYNGLIGGVPLQSAHCIQWNAGSSAERDRVAAALASSVGGATPYGRGTTLTGSQTQTLFDKACASPIAQNWLLYELYIRAAGFRSYVPR
jgi:ABC-type Co2+ transport system permease subunit